MLPMVRNGMLSARYRHVACTLPLRYLRHVITYMDSQRNA